MSLVDGGQSEERKESLKASQNTKEQSLKMELEEKYQQTIMDIIEKVNSSNDFIPSYPDGMKCYPLEIELKKGQSAGASLFGGFFRKFGS